MTDSTAMDPVTGSSDVQDASLSTRNTNNVPADSFFDSPTFSDITVCFGGETINAHKILLALYSPYFKRTLSSQVKQEHAGELHLDDDEPNVIRGLISFFYYLDYDGISQYCADNRRSDERPWITDASFDIAKYAMYLIGLFAAASKYEIAKLQTSTLKDIPFALKAITDFSTGTTAIDDAARLVYLRHKDWATELRPLIIKHITESITSFSTMQKFNIMLSEVPELATDLVKALAATVKVNASPAVKSVSAKRKAETPIGQSNVLATPVSSKRKADAQTATPATVANIQAKPPQPHRPFTAGWPPASSPTYGGTPDGPTNTFGRPSATANSPQQLQAQPPVHSTSTTYGSGFRPQMHVPMGGPGTAGNPFAGLRGGRGGQGEFGNGRKAARKDV